MSFASSVPSHNHSIPQPVMKSLQSWNFKGLAAQRDQARALCLDIQAMHQIYDDLHRRHFERYDDYIAAFTEALADKHPQDLTITPQKIADILTHAEHATLNAQGSENKDFMTRLCNEAVSPIALGSICAYPEKLELIADFLKKNPKQAVSFACGYPHSTCSATESQKQIEDVQKFVQKHKLKNPIAINTVADYAAWMDGDTDQVREIFAAEARACTKAGFTLKIATKSLAHASASRNTKYGEDYFKSVYDMATLAMEAARDEGLDDLYLQTGTGLPANVPFNNSVPLDTTYAESAAPLFMAVADFNAVNEPQTGIKVAGGIKNEKDIIGLSYLQNHSSAVEVTKPLVIETDIHSRAHFLGTIRHMMSMGSAPIKGMSLKSAPHDNGAAPAPTL